MLRGMSALNKMKPELKPYDGTRPNKTGTRKIEEEKLTVLFMPNIVALCFSGVTSASNASPTASSPNDAKPKITHGIANSKVGDTVMAKSEIDSTTTRTIRTVFLPKVSESLPHMGALNKPATFSIEKRIDASAISMPLPRVKYWFAKIIRAT